MDCPKTLDSQFIPHLTLETHSQNFQFLMRLKQPQDLLADENNRLYQATEPMADSNDRVRSIIQKILKCLNKDYKQSDKSEPVKKFYKKVFFNRFANLSEAVFDRAKICHSLLKALFPKKAESLKQLKSYSEEAVTADNTYYRTVVKVVKIALKLGIRPQPVKKGVSGTYLLKGLEGKILGVFKPCDEEVLSENSTSGIRRLRPLSKKFPLFPTLIFLQGGNGCKSECMASIVSRRLQLDNVPVTKMETLKSFGFRLGKSKTGSLQLYVPDAKSAAKALEIKRFWCFFPSLGQRNLKGKPELLEKIPQEIFEGMVILDFLIAQLDRHPDNWLVKESLIYLIDNGASMPHKHSDSMLTRLNQYIWRLLPHAEIPFTDYAKEVADTLEEEIEDIIEAFYRKKLIADPCQETKFRERAKVLIHFIQSDKTPYELSLIRSTNDFKIALEKS